MENARYFPVSIIAIVYAYIVMTRGKITMYGKLAVVASTTFAAIALFLTPAYGYFQFFTYNILTHLGTCTVNDTYCNPIAGIVVTVSTVVIDLVITCLATFWAFKLLSSQKMNARISPFPSQFPENLQEAGIEIFNNESSGSITNLRVELQNIGKILDGKLIGNVFPDDRHIVLNKSGGVVKPDRIPAKQSESIVISEIANHHVSFLFNRGAKPYMIATKGGDIEETDFELKIKILGNIDDGRPVERGPFKMRMVMTKPTDEHSWINIYFSSEEYARIAGVNLSPHSRA